MTLLLKNHPFFIGFERIFHELEDYKPDPDTYPPFNIYRAYENMYVIEMAVAGFRRDRLSIEVEDGTLTIRGVAGSGNPLAGPEKAYIHKGVAQRGFNKKFKLAEHVEVINSQLIDGMLTISLQVNLPENKKKKTIPILDTPVVQHTTAPDSKHLLEE